MEGVTFREIYSFLRAHYRHSRFEGRGEEYAKRIAESCLDQLNRSGWDVISRHESYNNQLIKFDHRLVDLNADLPPIDYAPQDSHLSHLLD